MSTLVVNSLKNSGGSAATLTLPTTDGTAGQVLKSTNGTGTLAFGGALIEAGNGTDLTFPNTAAAANQLQTDGSGNITAIGTDNPMVQGTHTGQRLVDRYQFSGGSAAAQVDLVVPTSMAADQFDKILAYKLQIRNVQTTGSSSWRLLYVMLQNQGSPTEYVTNTSATYVNQYSMLTSTSSKDVGQWNAHYGSGFFYTTSNDNIYRNSSGSSGDLHSLTTINANNHYNAKAAINCNAYFFNSTFYGGYFESWYGHSSTTTSLLKYNTSVIRDRINYSNSSVSDQNGTTKGRHPIGIRIKSSNGQNMSTGVVELYAIFKDGVL